MVSTSSATLNVTNGRGYPGPIPDFNVSASKILPLNMMLDVK